MNAFIVLLDWLTRHIQPDETMMVIPAQVVACTPKGKRMRYYMYMSRGGSNKRKEYEISLTRAAKKGYFRPVSAPWDTITPATYKYIEVIITQKGVDYVRRQLKNKRVVTESIMNILSDDPTTVELRRISNEFPEEMELLKSDFELKLVIPAGVSSSYLRSQGVTMKVKNAE